MYNNQTTLKLTGHLIKPNEQRPRSELHKRAQAILVDIFPTLQIATEVPIVVFRPKILYLDFFVPDCKLVIEVHGIQHYKFNTMFHSSAQDFINQKKNDEYKREWSAVNNFYHVELPYNEKDEEWIQRIQKK